MNRPLLIALLGIIVVAIAIGLNYAPWQQEEEAAPPPQAQAPAPQPEPEAKPEPEPMKFDPPTFDVVRVNPNGDAVIAGRAVPDSTVVNIDNDAEFGRVKADDRGEWVFVPEMALKPGTHTLKLKMLVGSAPPVMSVEDVVVIVPVSGHDIAGREGDGHVLALKMNPDGTSSVLQKPRAPSRIKLTVDTVDYDDNGRLSISGGAQPNAMIQLYLDNQFIGHARTGEDKGQGVGIWTMQPDDPVKPGLYTLRADHVDNGGKVLQRVEFPFQRAEPTIVAEIKSAEKKAEKAVEEATEATAEVTTEVTVEKKSSSIVVQPGNSLWRIARSNYGDGVRYTVIYEANADQITNPDLIYPGQVFKLPENQ